MQSVKKSTETSQEERAPLKSPDTNSPDSTMHQTSNRFDDGKRRIDYVLVYRLENEKFETKRDQFRRQFEANLQKRGLHLEKDKKNYTKDEPLIFVKIHAPWDVLALQAEISKLKMPIKKREEAFGASRKAKTSELCFSTRIPRSGEKERFFTAEFNRAMQEQFLISDRDTFFKDADRSRMVWNILVRTRFDSTMPDRVGIKKLIKNGTYECAYPLHDELSTKNGDDEGQNSASTNRQFLYSTWARPFAFFNRQPLYDIRDYFGEKLALYFAWLGYYTSMLIPAAILGFFCVLYGAFSLTGDIPSRDICDENGIGATKMCPSCDSKCFTWNLSEACIHSKMTYVFDNWFTVIFAACMAVWATLFLEGWKRYQASLAYNWDMTSLDVLEENLRPEYEMNVKTKEKNPVTFEWEPRMPKAERAFRVLASGISVLFFLSIIIIFVFGIIVYRTIVEYSMKLGQDQFLTSHATLITSISGAWLNLICIMILDRVYQALAYKLTAWEYPRTDSDFEDSYTFKVFMFEFINFNSSLFYIAFFKGKFSTVPFDRTSYLFGYPPEACDPAGCMVELLIQLAVIMVGKQLLNNFMEILFPIMSNKWRSLTTKVRKEKPRWVHDYHLNKVPSLHLFNEYLEMVLQYGFVTLFVPAFPLAPLFALINNVMEIRLDAYKLVVAYRRPMPARAKDLGMWFKILDCVSNIAVLCNACVIAFTSDFVPRLVYQIAYSADRTLNGYVENKMSYFDPEHVCNSTYTIDSDVCNIEFCRFMDYVQAPCSLGLASNEIQCQREPLYSHSITWWHVLAAKFIFVFVFENIVFMIKNLVAYLIPDIPHHIMAQMQRQNYLARLAFYRHEFEKSGGAVGGSGGTTPENQDVVSKSKKSTKSAGGENGVQETVA